MDNYCTNTEQEYGIPFLIECKDSKNNVILSILNREIVQIHLNLFFSRKILVFLQSKKAKI